MSFVEANKYFSISDILMSEERVSSEVQVLLPNLGFLSTSTQKEHLEPGSKLEIPIWLAASLSANRTPIISCELPKIYKESYREILEADSCTVELNKWNQYYYEFGLQLPSVVREDTQALPEFLLEVFKSRFRLIMDCEQSTFCGPMLSTQLTILEKKLLQQGNHGKMQLLNWLTKGFKQIKTSDVVKNIRKRKRMHF